MSTCQVNDVDLEKRVGVVHVNMKKICLKASVLENKVCIH